MAPVLEVSGGAVLMAIALLDVFLTVLYARAGTGVISPLVMTGTWRLFRAVGRQAGRHAPAILSMCGPVVVISLVFLWAAVLTLGSALIFHPFLGTAVTSGSGRTPTDFVAALFAAGNSLSIVGSGGFSPNTTGFRLLFLFNSLVGMSIISLTLTYLMQIYTALQKRNVAGLRLHLLSRMTDDSSELLLALAPQGRFESAESTIAEIASDIANLKEAHHFYPVLFYFRFPEPYYALSYTLGMALDSASLIASALDSGKYGWLQDSGVVHELWEGSLLLLDMGSRMLHVTEQQGQAAPSAQRFGAVLDRFHSAGIAIPADRDEAAERYAHLRQEWHAKIFALGGAMLYRPHDINPEQTAVPSHKNVPTFPGRLRSAH